MKHLSILHLAFLTMTVSCVADDDPQDLGSVEAQADMEWVEMPNTCATSISVGPNNVPWVTDCNTVSATNKHHKVWYLLEQCSGIACSKVWKRASGIVGNRVDVDFESNPTVTGTNAAFEPHISDAAVRGSTSWKNGRLVIRTPGPNQPILTLLGGWEQVSPFQERGNRNPGGCITQYMRKVNAGEKETLFLTPDWSEFGNGITTMYALGCGRSTDKRIFYADQSSVEQWTQLGARGNPYNNGDAVAKEMAFFSQTPANGLTQTPWFRDDFGHLFSYNGTQFVARPVPREGGVVSITDHFIATRNNIYQWKDNSNQWSLYMSSETPSGSNIKKIAYANGSIRAMYEWQKYVTVGSSQLWGIDQNGKIHYARLKQAPPR